MRYRRRAAKRGDGFLAMQHTPESAAELVAKLYELREEFGRERKQFEITVGSAVPATLDNVRRFEEAQVDRVTMLPWKRGDHMVARDLILGMERFADRVLSKI